MDTVDDFLRMLNVEQLEKLKATVVCQIIERRVLHHFRFLGKWFMVVIDGTGTNKYNCQDKDGTRLYKTSQNGTITYFHHLVEAKLVTSSGISISLASEWVSNIDTDEDK